MNKPLCVIQAPVFNRSGYGDWATTIAKSLLRQDKYDLKILPTRWGNCQTKRFVEELNDPNDQVLFSKFLQKGLDKQPDLFIQVTIPNEFQKVGKYNIGMTAGIETTACAGEWIEGINRMDLTIGLSNHVKKTFQDTKYKKKSENGKEEPIEVNKPMEVCFWGANTDIYKKTDIIEPNVDSVLTKISEKYAFLFVGQWTHQGLYNDRKDIGNLIKTFCSAFKNFEPNNRPCLILKTNGAGYSTVDRFDTLERINKIRNEVSPNSPSVYLLHGELNDVEMNSLFNHPKVISHISFTHGEGFGHPMLLSTLSGKPLLAPNWSGHLDYLNPSYANLLPGTLVDVDKKSVNEWIIKESKWFRVSYSLAEDKMKYIYQHRNNDKVIQKAEYLRAENAEKFSLQSMDTKLWSILDKYVPAFATENKFVLPKLKSVGSLVANATDKLVLPKLKMQ